MDYRIKDLPEQERPREKLEKNSASALSEVELLSLVLRTGIKGKNVKELSAEILQEHSLAELGNRDPGDLESFEGVSRVKAGQLVAVGELARRMQVEEREKIETFSDVKAQVEDMKHLDHELLRIFHLSSGNEILSREEFEGGVDSVKVEPRRILEGALKEGAAALVLAHNHPSKKAEPTGADIEFTDRLIEAAEHLGVDVLDHVIAGKTVSSMRGSGAADFPS
ncbi:MAG: RadC family protein [Candidatus Nanohaloarchaea archaeon]